MNESNGQDIAFANPAPAASSSITEVMDESQLLITTDQLMAHYRETGSHSTFEQLVKRYAPLVFSECISVTRNRHDAEDAAQAAFLTLAVHARGQSDIRKLGPWLQQVARRVALDQQKAKRRRTAREQKHHRINGYDQVATPELEGLDNAELRVAIQEELQQLPAKYRLPLILHYFGGMSRDQMAKELNCKAATLGVRIFRAREMLGKRLKKRGISLAPLLLLAFLTEVIGSNITGGLSAKAGVIATAAGMIHGGASTGVTSAIIPAAAQSLAVGSSSRIALRVKAMLTTAVLAASAVAGGAEIVHKITTGQWILPSLGGLTSWMNDAWNTSDTQPLDTNQQLPGLTSHGVSQVDEAWPAVDFSQSSIGSSVTPSGVALLSPVQPVVASSVGSASGLLSSGLAQSVRSASPSLAVKPSGTAPAVSVASAKTISLQNELPPLAASSPVAKDPVLALSSYDNSNGPSDRPATLRVGFGAIPGPGATVPNPVQIKPLTSSEVAQLLNSTASTSAGTGADTSVSGRITASGQSGSTSSTGVFGGTAVSSGVTVNGSSGSSGGAPITDVGSISGQSGADAGSTSTPVSSSSSPESAGSTSAGYAAAGSTSSGSTPGGSSSGGPSSGGSSSGTLSPALASAGASSMPLQMVTKLANPGVGTISPGQTTPATYVYSSLDGGATTSVLKGFGKVELNSALDESGIVVATGFGQQRTLDLSSATAIKNSISNTPGEPNGWYAVAGGRLELPQIPLTPGDNKVIWGDEAGPTAPDLVNSLVMNISAVKSAGQMSVSLLASDRSEVPALPAGASACSIWQISSSSDYASMSITGRAVDMTGCLWRFDGQSWSRLATSFDTSRMVFSAFLPSPSSFIALLDGGPTTSSVTSIAPSHDASGWQNSLNAFASPSTGSAGMGSAGFIQGFQTAPPLAGVSATGAISSAIGSLSGIGHSVGGAASGAAASDANCRSIIGLLVGPSDPTPAVVGLGIDLGTDQGVGIGLAGGPSDPLSIAGLDNTGDSTSSAGVSGMNGIIDSGSTQLGLGNSGGSIPEPSGMALVAAGLGVLLRRSRSRR